MEWYAAYLLLGVLVGFFAGLFGIGGGLVLVPVLSWLFEAQHLGGVHGLHLALGTSMAAILYTAIVSAYAHHSRSAVNLHIVHNTAPGMLLGALVGASFAGSISWIYLSLFFALFVYLVAAQMLFGFRPKASRKLPGRIVLTLVGSSIGVISSLVSIGGGALSVPLMLWHNIPLRQAIGTSAALGFPIALGGTVGYVVTGLALPALPGGALGFVYLPALFMVALGSAVTTPLGAKVTHSLPLEPLRRAFALLLFVLATRMLFKVVA